MSAELPLSMPTVPEGFCNSLNDSDWVQNLMNLIAQGVAILDGTGFTVLINSTTQPGVTDRDKLWRDPDTGLIYQFLGGAWVTPHPSPASGDERRWWTGTLVALQTYDGGSVGAVGDNSGPMWEEDTDMQGRSPMGPGAIPTSNPAKTLALDENFGEGAHTQTVPELALHNHTVEFEEREAAGAGNWGFVGYTGIAHAAEPTTNQGSSTPFNVTHPVRGMYCIRRTARLNYVGS